MCLSGKLFFFPLRIFSCDLCGLASEVTLSNPATLCANMLRPKTWCLVSSATRVQVLCLAQSCSVLLSKNAQLKGWLHMSSLVFHRSCIYQAKQCNIYMFFSFGLLLVTAASKTSGVANNVLRVGGAQTSSLQVNKQTIKNKH